MSIHEAIDIIIKMVTIRKSILVVVITIGMFTHVIKMFILVVMSTIMAISLVKENLLPHPHLESQKCSSFSTITM